MHHRSLVITAAVFFSAIAGLGILMSQRVQMKSATDGVSPAQGDAGPSSVGSSVE